MKIYFASQSFYPHIGGVSTYLLNLQKEVQKLAKNFPIYKNFKFYDEVIWRQKGRW